VSLEICHSIIYTLLSNKNHSNEKCCWVHRSNKLAYPQFWRCDACRAWKNEESHDRQAVLAEVRDLILIKSNSLRTSNFLGYNPLSTLLNLPSLWKLVKKFNSRTITAANINPASSPNSWTSRINRRYIVRSK